MKIIFAGTPDFAVTPLNALINEHDVVAVYTQPDRKAGRGKKLTPPPVKLLAEENNIPVFQPLTLKDQAQFMAQFEADVMVVVAYGMLLPQAVLDVPRLGCINIHASLLPKWRGAAPIQRSIEAGDTKTGVSIMKMEIGLDTGPVYQMISTPINELDTSSSMHEKLAILGSNGILSTLENLNTNSKITPQLQDDALATYAKKILKSEAEINWQDSAKQINARMRAFYPWPICQTRHQSSNDKINRIRLSQSTVIDESSGSNKPGTILELSDLGVIVACGENKLRLEVLQRDGSRPLQSREFCNGYALTVGDQFK